MAKIYESIEELIGDTPLLRAKKFCQTHGIKADILVKLECFNPTGSAKDRAALSMIEDGEKQGKLTADTVIIEPTSGNTGIALAGIAAVRGYKVILTMPETMSLERQKLLRAYGAKIVLTDGAKGMQGAIEKAQDLSKKIINAYIPSQFENLANPAAHQKTTGPEILKASGGKVDYFIAGIGTGGTLTGVGRYLKSKNKAVKIIAVEPKASPFVSAGKNGVHEIQGIGAGFLPKTLDTSILDEVITITNDESFYYSKNFARTEGILVGISAGAALAGAVKISRRLAEKKTLVVLLPDTGERYLSTKLFE